MADESSSSAIIQSSNMELRNGQANQPFPTVPHISNLMASMFPTEPVRWINFSRSRNLKDISLILQWTPMIKNIVFGNLRKHGFMHGYLKLWRHKYTRTFFIWKQSKNHGLRYRGVVLKLTMTGNSMFDGWHNSWLKAPNLSLTVPMN